MLPGKECRREEVSMPANVSLAVPENKVYRPQMQFIFATSLRDVRRLKLVRKIHTERFLLYCSTQNVSAGKRCVEHLKKECNWHLFH